MSEDRTITSQSDLEAKARAFRAGEQVTWQSALTSDEVDEFARCALDPGWEGSVEKTDDRWFLVVASKTAAGETTRTSIPLKSGADGA